MLRHPFPILISSLFTCISLISFSKQHHSETFRVRLILILGIVIYTCMFNQVVLELTDMFPSIMTCQPGNEAVKHAHNITLPLLYCTNYIYPLKIIFKNNNLNILLAPVVNVLELQREEIRKGLDMFLSNTAHGGKEISRLTLSSWLDHLGSRIVTVHAL